MRTLLWLYSDLVVHKNIPHSTEVFKKACLAYSQLRGVPPIATFAVAEDHFLSGPGKGLAGLDSGMAAPMGISSRVPPETREKLRHNNSAQRAQLGTPEWPAQAMPGYDEGEDAEMMGDYDEGEEEGDVPEAGPMQAFPMFTGMEAMNPELMGAWFNLPPSLMHAAMEAPPGGMSMHPGLADVLRQGHAMSQMPPQRFPHPQSSQRHHQGVHPASMLGGGPGSREQADRRHWPVAGAVHPQQWSGLQGMHGGNPQAWMQPRPNDDVSQPADQWPRQQQGGGGQEHGPPQRFKEEEEEEQAVGGVAPRPKTQVRPQQQADAASMLLSLANAADRIIDDGDPSSGGGSPSRKHSLAVEVPAGQRLRQKRSSGGVPPASQQHPSSSPIALPMHHDQVEERALARLAREALTSLSDSHQQQEQLRRQLKVKSCAGGSVGGGSNPAGLNGGAHEEQLLTKALRRRATNSSSMVSEKELLGGMVGDQGEGGAVTWATAASPRSSSREKDFVATALLQQQLRTTSPLAVAPGAAAISCMEDSVVETLGKLATDPSLSAPERVQLISAYMKAVQQFVKVTVEV